MRLIDADGLKKHKYHSDITHENVVSVAQIDWIPTVQAVPIEELQEIRQEITESKYNHRGEYNRELAFNICLQIIDNHIKEIEGSDKE